MGLRPAWNSCASGADRDAWIRPRRSLGGRQGRLLRAPPIRPRGCAVHHRIDRACGSAVPREDRRVIPRRRKAFPPVAGPCRTLGQRRSGCSGQQPREARWRRGSPRRAGRSRCELRPWDQLPGGQDRRHEEAEEHGQPERVTRGGPQAEPPADARGDHGQGDHPQGRGPQPVCHRVESVHRTAPAAPGHPVYASPSLSSSSISRWRCAISADVNFSDFMSCSTIGAAAPS